MTDPFELGKALTRKQKSEAAGGTAAVVGANEARGAIKGHRDGMLGRNISTNTAKVKPQFNAVDSRHVKPGEVNQKTLKPGVHQMSMDTINTFRNRPARPEGVEALKRKIPTEGVTSPVHLRVYQKGGAKLWDGNHRANAVGDLGHSSIPVSVTHVKGRKPRATTALQFANHVKHAKYRKGLMAVAKNDGVSAFGVEHNVLEKGIGAMAGTAVKDSKSFMGAMKTGFNAGARAMPSKPMAMGNAAGAGTKKALGHISSAFKTTPVKVAATSAGVGAAGLGGYKLSRNR